MLRSATPKKKKKQHSSLTLSSPDVLSVLEDNHTVALAELQRLLGDIMPRLKALGCCPLYLSDQPAAVEREAKLQEIYQMEQDGTGKLSPVTVDVLRAMRDRIDSVLSQQQDIRSVVKIQAIARGWLVRRQMQEIRPHMSSLKHIGTIFTDLVKTERQYINDLKTTINKYLVPCRAKAVSQEDIHDVVAIFGNIETILNVHQPLLREILHIQEYRWPYFSGLGRLFMKHASEFQSYGDFAENYTMSRTTLSNILENKKHKFREVLEPSSGQLRQLLLGPLRRVAKYASVLEAFLNRSTGLTTNELENLSRAQAIMTNINVLVNRNLEMADRSAENKEIQRVIAFDSPFQLHNETRFLVHQGDIHSISLKKLHYYLFNDILLLTKPQGDRQKLVYLIDLLHASMEAKPEAVYELSFPHEKEKVQLQFRIDKGLSNLERIQKQIFKHKKTGVIFGIPVDQVLRQEKRHIDDGGSGIPMVVEFIVEYLRQNALETEGLLRVAGKFDNIEGLRKLLDNSSLKNYDSIALSSYKTHDIAAVLRIFFREMPEPVIPFEMYEPLMEVQRNADLERSKRVEIIRKIIIGLSPSSTALLCYLIGFLQDIEEHSAVNKMTVSNLAIVFGPNLIRPRVQTVQCALEMPLLQGILQILIEHSDDIWGEKPKERANHKRRTDRHFSTLYVGKELCAITPAQEETPMPVIPDLLVLDKPGPPEKGSKAKMAYLSAVSPPASPQLSRDKDTGSLPTSGKVRESLRLFEQVKSVATSPRKSSSGNTTPTKPGSAEREEKTLSKSSSAGKMKRSVNRAKSNSNVMEVADVVRSLDPATFSPVNRPSSPRSDSEKEKDKEKDKEKKKFRKRSKKTT